MKKVADRNFEIATARLSGEPLRTLAQKYGLHINSISRIAQENAHLVIRCDNRLLPRGLTVRAAVALEDALGIWPVEKDRKQIAERFTEILAISIRRAVLLEIKDWLRTPVFRLVKPGHKVKLT